MSDINEVIRRVLDLDREATGGPWTPQTVEGEAGHPSQWPIGSEKRATRAGSKP